MKALNIIALILAALGLFILLASLAAPGDEAQTALLGAIGLAVIPYCIVEAVGRMRR